MKTAREHLTGQQIVAASMVAWGVEEEKIAKRLSISRSTVQLWKRKPQFKALVTEFCNQAIDVQRESWTGVLSELMEGSAGVLAAFRREFIDPPISMAIPAEVKLRAYQLYWRCITHSIEALDFHDRLTRLENGETDAGRESLQD